MGNLEDARANLKLAAAKKRKARGRKNKDTFAEHLRKLKGDSGNYRKEYPDMENMPRFYPDRPGEPKRRFTPTPGNGKRKGGSGKEYPDMEKMPRFYPDPPGKRPLPRMRPTPGNGKRPLDPDTMPRVTPDKPGKRPLPRITPGGKHPLVPNPMPRITPDRPGDRKRIIRPVPGPPRSNVPIRREINPPAKKNAVRNFFAK